METKKCRTCSHAVPFVDPITGTEHICLAVCTAQIHDEPQWVPSAGIVNWNDDASMCDRYYPASTEVRSDRCAKCGQARAILDGVSWPDCPSDCPELERRKNP